MRRVTSVAAPILRAASGARQVIEGSSATVDSSSGAQFAGAQFAGAQFAGAQFAGAQFAE
ncbi:MAG: pentapeptide repeat-containing protein [Candidatus Binataceae bacterium]